MTVLIGRHTTLFFDASVFLAGTLSPAGGSGLVLAAYRAGGFRPQTSAAVVMESMAALRGYPGAPARLYRHMREIKWEFLPIPPPQVLRRYQEYTAAKDVHVLASACEGGSESLLTRDKRHLLSVAPVGTEGRLRVNILTPGDFIREYYTQHADYPHLPPARSSR